MAVGRKIVQARIAASATHGYDEKWHGRARALVKKSKSECPHRALVKYERPYGMVYVCDDCDIELVEAGN